MQPLIFQEVQYMPGWALLLLATIGVLLPLAMWFLPGIQARRQNRASATVVRVTVTVLRGAAVFSFLVPAAILLCYGKMTTEVAGPEVRVRFGWLIGYAETIPVADVQKVEVVRYDAVEYGGWGLRGRGPNDRALTMRGDQGVRLQLEGDWSLLIGSQRPEELAGAIAQARQQSGKDP